MKRIGVERLSRFIKFGTGAVIGAAAIAVFCRGYISLKNSSSSDIVTSTLTVSTVSTASSASSFSKSTQQPSSSEPQTELININTATSEELQTLPGIGEVKAAAIIAYREEHGAFSDISEIINVSGIGEKTFENIRGRITV